MHMIDTDSIGRASFVYKGRKAWHGLGTERKDNDIPGWTVDAGMGYDILRAPVKATIAVPAFEGGAEPTRRTIEYPKQHLLYRSDTFAPLATVGDGYKIVQPGEVLEFFEDLVSAAGDYDLETAGVLDGGSRYWALARYREAMDFGAGDIVKPYLLLATGVNGTATTADHVTERVVCANTMAMALAEESTTRVKLSHRSTFAPDAAKKRLGVGAAMRHFATSVDDLINTAMSRQEACNVFCEAVAEYDDKGNIKNDKHMRAVVKDIMDSLDNGPGSHLETARGSAWGALNAVTHYIDYKARARGKEDGGAHNRFKSAQFGAGAKFKGKVAEMLLAA